MNINDFKAPEERPQDVYLAMLNRQKELMVKYHDIEKSSGLLQTEDCPVDLDSKYGQARLKDFSWRITEELAEALEAYQAGDEDHFLEELIDALHFMLEQQILAGFKPSYLETLPGVAQITENIPPIEKLYKVFNELDPELDFKVKEMEILDIIYNLGLAMNTLKNKPWKQSHMLTDKKRFYYFMNQAFFHYMSLMMYRLDITPDQIYDLYFRKSQVNDFRQRSRY